MKESSESHDTIMTAGSTASAFPKADKSPVNQQQGEIHVLRTLEQIQAIRPIWEALQSELIKNMNRIYCFCTMAAYPVRC
jgi:hypothetical protein